MNKINRMHALLALSLIMVASVFADYVRYDWNSYTGGWGSSYIRSSVWEGDIYFNSGQVVSNHLVRMARAN
jgi:hypothetical protein